MKSSKPYATKEKRTDPQTEYAQMACDEIERCPECGHAWNEVGPAHFTDCRYFSLDDDRDEDPMVLPAEWGYLSSEAA